MTVRHFLSKSCQPMDHTLTTIFYISHGCNFIGEMLQKTYNDRLVVLSIHEDMKHIVGVS